MNCKNEQHDYENAIRKGRAHYVCPSCAKDITMDLVLMEECRRSIHPVDLILTDGTPAKTNEEKSVKVKINFEVKS